MRLRILAVSACYPPAIIGGMEIRLSVILRGLEERGHQCMVLTSKFNGPRSRIPSRDEVSE